MKIHVRNLTEEDARQICTWRYDGEYSVYNYPEWEIIVEQNWGLAQDLIREKEFFAVVNEKNELIGHFRLKEQEDFIYLGVGLTPELCGLGNGSTVMELVKNVSKERYPDKLLALEVRAFNHRAMKCYQKAGFRWIDIYELIIPSGRDIFVRMEYRG
jgi:ribosomal protein S18 acetylase RimI-like enzyme